MLEYLEPSSVVQVLTLSQMRVLQKLTDNWQIASTLTFHPNTIRYLFESFQEHQYILPLVEREETYVGSTRFYMYRLSEYGKKVQSFLPDLVKS